MDQVTSAAINLKLDTERLCLDFANTAEWHASDQPHEYLNSYVDLVTWAQQAGLLTAEKAEQLNRQASGRATEAEATLKRAIDLREAIYRIFSTIAGGGPANVDDLALLNRRLPEALARLRLRPAGPGFVWVWQTDEAALDQMLWPVVRSAAELLTSPELVQVKVCEDDRGCGFLFLDTSRNRSRRWCSMTSCGNRAKVRRHRRRKLKITR
jgi:predicted RNA-binding Zn ribbon-like protein